MRKPAARWILGSASTGPIKLLMASKRRPSRIEPCTMPSRRAPDLNAGCFVAGRENPGNVYGRSGLELAGCVLTRARGPDIIEQTTKDHSSPLIRDKGSGP
jgi:hypothetical protein